MSDRFFSKLFGLSLMTLAMLFLSCGEGASDESNVVEVEQSTETVTVSGIILFQGLSYYDQLRDDVSIRSTGSFSAGTIVPVTEERGMGYLVSASSNTAPRYEYAQVINPENGNRVWVLSNWVAIDAVPAVMTQESFIHTEPDVTSIQDTQLPVGFIVARLGGEPENGFIRVSWRDPSPNSFTRFDRWVRASNLSTREQDLRAMELLASAATRESAELKQIILSEAINAARNPAIRALVQTELDALSAPAEEEVVEDMTVSEEEMGMGMTEEESGSYEEGGNAP